MSDFSDFPHLETLNLGKILCQEPFCLLPDHPLKLLWFQDLCLCPELHGFHLDLPEICHRNRENKANVPALFLSLIRVPHLLMHYLAMREEKRIVTSNVLVPLKMPNPLLMRGRQVEAGRRSKGTSSSKNVKFQFSKNATSYEERSIIQTKVIKYLLRKTVDKPRSILD